MAIRTTTSPKLYMYHSEFELLKGDIEDESYGVGIKIAITGELIDSSEFVTTGKDANCILVNCCKMELIGYYSNGIKSIYLTEILEQ